MMMNRLLPTNYFISQHSVRRGENGEDWSSDAEWISEQLAKLPISKRWVDKNGEESSYAEYAVRAYDYVWNSNLPDLQAARTNANTWLRRFVGRWILEREELNKNDDPF